MVNGNFNPKHPDLYQKSLDPVNAEEDVASVSNEMSSSSSSSSESNARKK
jgi:hypothetical protein